MQRQSLVTLSTLAFAVGFAAHYLQSEGQAIRITPHSLVLRIQDGDRGGDLGLMQRYVKADGSMVERTSPTQSALWDIPNRTETVIDSSAKAYVVAPLLPRRLGGFLHKAADCVLHFGGSKPSTQVTCTPLHQRRFGHDLVNVRIVRRYPDGSSSVEVVHAIKELGWIPLRTEQYDKSGRLGISFDVVDFREGEPDSSQFVIPKDYRAARDFVEFERIKASSQGASLSEEVASTYRKKWESVTKQALAAGDKRFNN
jgi:hypothetical protein